MKKTAIMGTVFLSLLFSSCTEIWGELDNPADPAATSYQGYETIKDPDAIAPVRTDTGIVVYVPKLVATKVAGATAYQFRIAVASDFAVPLYTSAEVAVNEYLPVDCFGLSATTTYYWSVRAKADGTWGEWSTETATFSLSSAEPDTANPVNQATITDTTPAFNWSDVAGANGYRIQISAASDFTTTVTDNATLTASEYMQAAALENDATYWWRVMARNTDGVWSAWTSSRRFTVTTERPSLVTPAEAVTITDTTPDFDWSDVSGATGYLIQISVANDFTTTVTDGSTLTASAYMQAAALENEATYWWRVMAMNADGVWSAWTGARSFTVSVERPSLAVPSDAVTVTDTTPAFDWSDVVGATGYRIQISAAGDFATTVTDTATLTASAYTQTVALENEATYWWRVMAKNADGVWSAWTGGRSFSINFGAVSVLSPLFGENISDRVPHLDWADAPNAISYILQITATEEGIEYAPELSLGSSGYQNTDILAIGDTRWWRVCAVNEDGLKGPWIATSFYTIVSIPPTSLLTPTDSSISTNARPAFNWTTMDGAVTYEIALATSLAGLDGATHEVVAETGWTPSSDVLQGTWYWHIRSVDVYGAKGEWSVAWSFERPYAIGDIGPAEGIVFYDKGNVSDGWRYLETAPSDQSTGIAWWNGSHVATGATATAIGTGKANTATIVSVQGAGNYAASLCDNLSQGGYDDWFLPSKDEWNAMYIQRGVIGGFSFALYWSSSESDDIYAWNQDPPFGTQNNYNKNSSIRVRAIRAF